MKIKNYKDFNSINESKIIDTLINLTTYLLSPIIIPIFYNSNTRFKLKTIEKSINTYLKDKAKYQVLDEARYDIEQPSILKKITKMRNDLSPKFKKYPTLTSYKEGFCSVFRKANIINFRNGEDIDWLCDEIMKLGPEDEETELKRLKSRFSIDIKTGELNDLDKPIRITPPYRTQKTG